MLLTCQFRSAVLRRNTAITVILPTPELENEPIAKDMKVLYLLHGLYGDESSWIRYSNVERYAKDLGGNLAIVMPGVGNSFYQDMAHGERFFTYMTEELPKFIQGLSRCQKNGRIPILPAFPWVVTVHSIWPCPGLTCTVPLPASPAQ